MPKPVITNSTPGENEGEPKVTSTANPGTATPAGTGENQSSQSKSFNQSEVDDIVGKARVQARKAATSSFLEQFGFEKMDDVSEALKAWKEHRQEQMSELERAQESLSQYEGVNDKLTAAEKQVEQLNELLDKQIAFQVEQLEIPDHIKPLLEAMPLTERLNYLTEHGEQFAKTEVLKPPNSNAGNKGGNNSTSDKEKRRRIADKYGIR